MRLVLAATANQRQNRQVRYGIKPFLCRAAGRLGSRFRGLAQMLYPAETAQMLQADSCEPGYLFLGKDLLAGADCEGAHS